MSKGVGGSTKKCTSDPNDMAVISVTQPNCLAGMHTNGGNPTRLQKGSSRIEPVLSPIIESTRLHRTFDGVLVILIARAYELHVMLSDPPT
jgi:hypothetical protein